MGTLPGGHQDASGYGGLVQEADEFTYESVPSQTLMICAAICRHGTHSAALRFPSNILCESRLEDP